MLLCAVIQEAASNLSLRGWKEDTGRREVGRKMQKVVAGRRQAGGGATHTHKHTLGLGEFDCKTAAVSPGKKKRKKKAKPL